MNASSFKLSSHNGIRFYKGLYVTFKLAPDLKKNTEYLSSYSPLNEGHFSIQTNSVLRLHYIIRLFCRCAAVPAHETYIAPTAHPVLCTHFGFKKGIRTVSSPYPTPICVK